MLTGPRYTRRVILDGSSPYHSRGQLRSLDLELASFEESLPEELQLNDNRLMLMCHSDEARAYTILHTLLFSCRCDLHRFLIPGIRECVSPEAAAQTPREYIDYCQRRCLQSALSSCDLWSKIRHLETSSRLETPTLAVVTYQSVKIIDHLTPLLPDHGDDSLPAVKEKLADALFIVSRIQTGIDWIASCVSYQPKCYKQLTDDSDIRHREAYPGAGYKIRVYRITASPRNPRDPPLY